MGYTDGVREIELKKRQLINLRKIVHPIKDLLAVLESMNNALIESRNKQYNKNLRNSCVSLLEDIDALTNILLYHIAEGLILAEDLEDGMEIDMLNGATSDITIDEDGLVRINDSAIVVTSDIEASNGIIHVIDTVLSPPAERSMLLPPSPSTGELCSISAESADSARVRVGPGENRTSVTFLPAGQNFPVLGIFEDEDGNTWFQLDKEEAAPGRAINEAWVAATDVDSTGDCDNIAETDAPPIIPISSNQTANTGGGSGNPVINASNNGSTIWIAYAPWAGQLPANLQASSRASADLIVEASDELVNEESFSYMKVSFKLLLCKLATLYK